ncbi:LacI family DNA-binding transcriptional regulator [Aestuariimicrobium soli]|uniref:LacI family DNA-binding transcriptional regulator n=1 Tax=Aestuariimicrobium soli TaxID=2035834 RepID=UPI003EB7224E
MATLKDVAREAGVAVSTVSRAFTHPERLNADTVARIREVAEQMNYRVNPLAKALITGSSPIIGMLVTDIADPFMTSAIKGAQAEAYEHGLWLAVGDTNAIDQRESEWADTMSDMARGLILLGARASDEALRSIAERKRLVLLQRSIPGVACELIESRPAMVAILDHLMGHGHRHLAYLPGPSERWMPRHKLAVFTELCSERDVTLTVLPHTESTIKAGESLTDAVLASGATAAVCANDRMAQGVVAALFRRNFRPPDNLSVVGHDDSLRDIAVPSLTTTTDLAADLGRAAVRRLLAEGDLSPTTQTLTAGASFRDSSGPAPVH